MNPFRSWLLCPFALLILALIPMVGLSQILDVRELNVEQIKSLDRQRTVVILQGGILEEHGPFLPIYSDGWLNEFLGRRLAESIVARPGWKVLIFPVIPLGSGGANELAGKRSFPGTFAVRPATLRAVYMDLADELGIQGFRWVFLMNAHGAPSHSRALFDASDYYRDTYGFAMVHLWGLAAMGQWFEDSLKLWDDRSRKENGFLVHADMFETSYTLFLKPTAVQQAASSQAKSYASSSMAEVLRFAAQPDWPGYGGAPRLANAAFGARAIEDATERIRKMASEILNGRDPGSFPRRDDVIHSGPEQDKVDATATAKDRALEKQQTDWLNRRKR